jgi:HD-GYP domain-containing protein (c-di-GMP phosphodiesterase class II)
MTGRDGSNAETPLEHRWRARPVLATLLRIVAASAPVAALLAAVWLLDDVFWRPDGTIGAVVWIAQAAIVGLAVAATVDRMTRRLLPLAALYDLTLLFPGDAPSRVRTAIRAATPSQRRRRVAEVRAHGLGATTDEAAATAIEMVLALGSHDRLARDHSERVRHWADRLACELGLSRADRDRLALSVIVHDIGKIAVPAEILNQPGRPTEAEWEILRTHPLRGAELLEPLVPWLGEWALAASQHHERWDGGGYPLGLAGDEISLAGRIAAVADTFSVIAPNTSYERAITHDGARQEMLHGAGSQFDPELVQLLLSIPPERL